MISLTPRQQDALRFIIGFRESFGIAPTMIEIAKGIGMSTKSMAPVQWLLDCLEARGAIRREPFVDRAIQVVKTLPIPRAPDGAPLHFISFEGED
jgi:SOS-response transcriptional repressor LexA